MSGDDRVLYLYGIVQSGLNLLKIEGIEPGSQVSFVESAGLACAVTAVPAREYARPHEGNSAAQAEWIAQRAWRHHEVLAALHAAATVLPLKFGSISRTEDDVKAMLEDLREPVGDLLAKHARKDEWTLKISADPARVSDRLQQTDPALLALKQAEDAYTDGRRYFARKKLLQSAAECVDQHLAAVQDDVFRRLAPLVAEIARDPRSTGNAPDKNVIAAAALLVDRDAFASLNATLAELEAEHADEALSFDLVGPWPPYSFTTAIERARF